MMASASASGGDAFNTFYSEIKQIEKQDASLTSQQQIDRLLKKGSTYFNLNPFEVLQVPPDMAIEDIKRKYKRMSILVHPDKNPHDRERADAAFAVLKKAVNTLEDPDELDRCRQVIEEAKAWVHKEGEEKRKVLKKEGKPTVIDEDDPVKYANILRIRTLKIFAENERKRQEKERRYNEEKKRMAEEDIEQADAKRAQDEYAKNFDESREDRMSSWQKFKVGRKAKKTKTQGLMFKPPKPKLETSIKPK